MDPSEPRATANESYDARSWAPAAVISVAVASVRNVTGPPIGAAAIGAVRGPIDGTWMRRTSTRPMVTRIRTTRRAVWPCLLRRRRRVTCTSDSRDATARTLGFWPKFEIEAGSVHLLLRDDPRRLEDPALEDERVIVRRVTRSAQFHASDPSLDVRVVDALHLRVDDAVAQV